MARNKIEAWHNITLTEKEVAAVRAIIEGAFKAAGGRGDMGPISTGKILKGELGFDAARFAAGNVEDDSEVANAEAWALAILSGAGTLDELAAWPGMQKMVARMIAASKAAPAPKAPPAPPAPKAKAPPAPVVKAAPVAPKAKAAPGPYSVAARLGASHGVTITRKGKRAA